MTQAGGPAPSDFDRPPVVETVLGVHFKPIRGLTTAHLGLFWELLGRDDWPKLRELGAIRPQIERFDESPTAPLRFALEQIERPEVRLRLDGTDQSKVIQVQQNLLLTHWVRNDAPYPKSTKPVFLAVFSKWCEFLSRYRLPAPEPVQWEVTYINRIPAGELWSTPRDWQNVFRGVLLPPTVPDGSIESAMAEYHYRLSGDQGRLHVNVRHVVQDQSAAGLIEVIMTARGAVARPPTGGETDGLPIVRESIVAGLDIGRLAIVRGFKAITSEKAHEYWGIREASDE